MSGDYAVEQLERAVKAIEKVGQLATQLACLIKAENLAIQAASAAGEGQRRLYALAVCHALNGMDLMDRVLSIAPNSALYLSRDATRRALDELLRRVTG